MDKSSPYVGPRAYRAGEELFGRDNEARDLLRLILAERIVLLYSPSGAGKTSLLVAKVLPALREDEFHVLTPARVLGSRAGRALGGSVNRYAATIINYWEEGRPPDTQPLADLTGIDLAGYLTQRSWIRDRPGSTLLVLDQFEEVLTHNPEDRNEKREFFRQLGVALHDRDRWALIAMREEYIAGLDPYLDLLPTRLAARYRLELLTHDKAREAIAGPARSAGVLFGAKALDKLIAELTAVREPGGETSHTAYVEPLHLQVACERLWQRLPDGTAEVDPRLIDTAGTVGEALAGYYRDAVRTVAQTNEAKDASCDEKRIRDWFESELISTSGLREQIQRGAKATGGLPNAVVEALESRYLLRPELRRGTSWYEIAHDRLIEAIKADNQSWYATQDEPLRLLRYHGRSWQEHRTAGRFAQAEAELLGGTMLARVEDTATRLAGSLSRTDRQFLEACRERRKKDRDRSRRQWVYVAIAAGAAVAFFVIAVVLRRMNSHLDTESTRVRVHNLLSEAAAARWRRDEHELAALLALQAEQYLGRLGDVGDLGALKPRIDDTLRGVIQLRPFALSPPVQANAAEMEHVGKRTFAHDGRSVAVQVEDTLIRIVPLIPAAHGRTELRVQGPLRALDYSTEGRYLMAVTEGGIELFSAAALTATTPAAVPLSPTLRVELPAASSGTYCMAKQDSRLFAVLGNGQVARWEIKDDSAKEIGPPLQPADGTGAKSLGATAMACDPEGRWVAVGDTVLVDRQAMGRITLVQTEPDTPVPQVSLINRFNEWPQQVRSELGFFKDRLDFRVSALVPWVERNQLVAVFRQGPIGIVSLPTTAGEEPRLTYVLPTQGSEAELRVSAAMGRTSRSVARKPKLFRAAFDPVANRLLVGGDRTLGLWELDHLYRDPEGPYGDGMLVVAGNACAAEPQCVPDAGPAYAAYREMRAPNAGVEALDVLQRGKVIAAADAAFNVRLWLTEGLGRIGYSALGSEGDDSGPGVLWSVGFLPDGHTVAAGGSRYLSFLEVSLEPLGMNRRDDLPCYAGSFRAMSLSPDRRLLALAAKRPGKDRAVTQCDDLPGDSSIAVWLMATRGEAEKTTVEHQSNLAYPQWGLWSLSWSSNPGLLAAADFGGNVRVWALDPETGVPATATSHTLSKRYPSAAWTLALHPTQPWLAVGTEDGTLDLWHLEVGADGRISERRLDNPAWVARGPLRTLAFSPDGDVLVFGDDRGWLGVVPTHELQSGTTWKASHVVFAHAMGVNGAAFCGGSAPAGRTTMASRTGEPYAFATAGSDGAVRLWQIHLDDGKPSLVPGSTLQGPTAEALSVACSPDGNLVVAGDAEGKIHLWSLASDPLIDSACKLMRRNLSWAEWLTYVGATEPYECTCPSLPPGLGVPSEVLNSAVDAGRCRAGR